MTFVRCALALLALSACAGASDDAPSTTAPEPSTDQAEPADEEPEPTAETPAADVAAFHLEWQRASGPVLRDQISVRGDGQLLWVAGTTPGDPTSMHAATLQLTEAEVRSVRDAVEAADFFALPAEITGGVSDGSQVTMRVQVGDRTHRVRVEEPFPPAVTRIVAAVDALLTEPRRAALTAAPLAQPEDFDPSLVD